MTTWTDWVLVHLVEERGQVVVLPLPVAPVTRTRPVFSLAISLKIGGRPRLEAWELRA